MKPVSIVLAASLAANLSCVAAFFLARSAAPTGTTSDPAVEPPATDVASGASGATAGSATSLVEASTDAGLWTRLHNEDPAAFEENLRAAGLPPHVVSALLAADARERLRLRTGDASEAVARATGPARTDPTAGSNGAVRRTSTATTAPPGPLGRNLEFIDPARRDAVREIARDYDAMLADIRRNAPLLTDAEKEMIATLEAERRRDLEPLLTPTELADFEMLKSPLYSRLTSETSEFQPTLEEFRAIYALEKQYTERFGRNGMSSLPPNHADRQAADQFRATLDDQLLLAFGTDRFSEYDRSRNHEYRELSKLVRRVNLPASHAVEVFSIRDFVSVESNRIVDDASLNETEKQTALRTLAAETRTRITRQLGDEAGAAYIQMANRWITAVEQGSAVTFKSHYVTHYRPIKRPRPPSP